MAGQSFWPSEPPHQQRTSAADSESRADASSAAVDGSQDRVRAGGACQVLELVTADDMTQLVDGSIAGMLAQLRHDVSTQRKEEVRGLRVARRQPEQQERQRQHRIELHEVVGPQIAAALLLGPVSCQHAGHACHE